MTAIPPHGSNITVDTDGGDTVISVPQQGRGLAQYGAALFLLFWLGGWAVGLTKTVGQLMAGRGSAFLVFWLGGWTVGGVLAACVLYRLVRPSVPATLRLTQAGIAYDAGITPLQLYTGWGNPRPPLSSYFPRRVRILLTRQQLQSLRLRPTDVGNRLTVDVDAKRIELAVGASEIEREWLYGVLAERYAIAAAP